MGGANPELSPQKQEGGVRGRDRTKGSPASGALGPPGLVGVALKAPTGLSGLHGEVSLGLVTRPSWVFAQTPSRSPHGSAELAAAGRAALGPCRSPELLWRLRAAGGLVSE